MNNRRWLSAAVVVAVALLALSAQPVAAVNTVTVYETNTHDEFDNGQLGETSKLTVSGQDAIGLGDRLLSDEEDGDVSEWTSNAVLETDSARGDYSVRVPTDGSATSATKPISTSTSDEYSFWLKDVGSPSNNLLRLKSGSSDVVMRFFFNSDKGLYLGESEDDTTGEKITNFDTGWQKIELRNINYSNREFDIYVDNTFEGTYFFDSTNVPDTLYLESNLGGADAGAAIDSFQADDGTLSATYTSESYSADDIVAGRADVDLSGSGNTSATVTWQQDADSDGQWTDVASSNVTSTQLSSQDLSTSSSDRWRVQVQFKRLDRSDEVRLLSHELRLENDDPVLDESSADPTVGDDPSQTLKIDVSDQQMDNPYGETVDVTFHYGNGSVIGTDTLTSNGTAKTNVDATAGQNVTWYAEASDSFGGSTGPTSTFEASVPGTLRIYNETQPTKLVTGDNLSLTVRFFESGSPEITTREVTDGTVDLSGLPADERITVTVKANQTDRYTYRRVVIDSIYETNEIYLLNTSVASSQVNFELDSPTGAFPPGETTLYIEKPITKNNETKFRVIAGDDFGSTGSFPAVLQNEERYRLRVETDDGQRRVLGPYTVTGDTTEVIRIDNVDIESNGDQGAAFDAAVESYDNDLLQGTYIAVRYRDFADNTSTLTYEVKETDGTVIVPNQTVSNPSQTAEFYQLTQSEATSQLRINWFVERGGETMGGTVRAGQVSEIGTRFDIDPQVLSLMSWGMIMSSMGLVVIIDGKLSGIVGTGVAAILTVIGTVAIPLPLLAIAGVISIIALVGRAR